MKQKQVVYCPLGDERRPGYDISSESLPLRLGAGCTAVKSEASASGTAYRRAMWTLTRSSAGFKSLAPLLSGSGEPELRTCTI